jgi:hypothetical protein
MIYVVGTYLRRGRRFLANNRRSTLTNRLLTSEGPRPPPAVSVLASPPLEIYRGFVEAAIAGDKCHSALDGEGQGSIPLDFPSKVASACWLVSSGYATARCAVGGPHGARCGG